MQEEYYLNKLYPLQDRVLRIIETQNQGFYLTGGTALSRFYLNHRYSDDLDFFVNNIDDFKSGYSPERINPGDKKHTLATIIKVVSGCDQESLDTIAKVYELVVKVGVHRASSIKVAEAAKIIENTQRDLNIALMNELSIIFDRMNINTFEVLDKTGSFGYLG